MHWISIPATCGETCARRTPTGRRPEERGWRHVRGVPIDDAEQHSGIRPLRKDSDRSRVPCDGRKRTGGEDDERNPSEIREDIPAVEERHHEVQDHETWAHVAAADRPQGLATSDDCDTKARALEQRAEPGASLDQYG